MFSAWQTRASQLKKASFLTHMMFSTLWQFIEKRFCSYHIPQSDFLDKIIPAKSAAHKAEGILLFVL